MDYQQRIDKLNDLKTKIDSINIENSFSSQSTEVAGWEGGKSKEKFIQCIEDMQKDVKSLVDYIHSFSSELSGYISKVKAEFDEKVNSEVSRLKGIKGKKASDTKTKRHNALNTISDHSVRQRVAEKLGL